MSTINLRSALIRYPGTSIMGATKRIYKLADVHTVLYIENITNAAFVEEGLGLHGVELPVIDTSKAPADKAFGNRSYFKRFYEQIKALVKDLNAKKIMIYDPIEYPCLTTRFPNVWEAMFDGVTDDSKFTAEVGEINDEPAILIKSPEGVTPKPGAYSFYGSEDLKVKIDDTEREFYCQDGNIVVVPEEDTDVAEETEITLELPGFVSETVAIPKAATPDPDPDPGNP